MRWRLLHLKGWFLVKSVFLTLNAPHGRSWHGSKITIDDQLTAFINLIRLWEQFASQYEQIASSVCFGFSYPLTAANNGTFVSFMTSMIFYHRRHCVFKSILSNHLKRRCQHGHLFCKHINTLFIHAESGHHVVLTRSSLARNAYLSTPNVLRPRCARWLAALISSVLAAPITFKSTNTSDTLEIRQSVIK